MPAQEERRQRMPALPARHVEQALFLPSRRHRQPLRLPELRPRHARHVGVARQLVRRRAQPALEHRQRDRDRMRDRGRVAPAPGGPLQRRAVGRHLVNRAVDGGQLQRVPVGVAGRQPGRRPLVQQALDGGRPARTGEQHRRLRIELRHRLVGRAEQQVVQRPAVLLRQPVAHRTDARVAVPARLQQPAERGAGRVAVQCLRVEGPQRALAPAIDVQGAVVQAGVEHVAHARLGRQRRHAVAQLAGARAQVETAVAQQRRGRCGRLAQLAAVGRHELAARRVDDARMRARGQQAVPGGNLARLGQRERNRQPALRTARQRAGDGPADVAPRIAQHDVLGRDAVVRRRIQRPLERRSRLQLQVVQVDGARRMRRPVHGITRAARLADGAEAGLAHHHALGRLALHQDRFRMLDRRFPAARQADLAGVAGIALHADEVQRVGIAVGERPGHVAVAADDDERRRTRQADAHHALRRTSRIREAQRQPVPDVRQLQAQVHVVGHDGGARRAARSGHGVVIAADRVDETDARHLARRYRVLAAPPRWRRGRNGRGDRGNGGCIERRVPGARLRQQEGQLRRVGMAAQPVARQLARLLVALQVEVHRPHHQQRIGGRPAARRGAAQEVFEGARRQGVQPVVDAGDVAVEEGAFGRRQPLQRGLGAGAEAVQPVRAVERQRLRPEQLGQLAGGAAAQQVHLEEAFLAVHEAGRVGQVEPVGAANRRHAVGVARHRDRRRQPRRTAFAVELGQTGAQGQPRTEECQHQQRGDQPKNTPTPSPPPTSSHAASRKSRHRARKPVLWRVLDSAYPIWFPLFV
jgi:hypothetical protein